MRSPVPAGPVVSSLTMVTDGGGRLIYSSVTGSPIALPGERKIRNSFSRQFNALWPVP